MNTNRELPQNFIQRWQLAYMDQSLYIQNYSSSKWVKYILILIFVENISRGLKMEIVFKRRLMNELLTTYLPSLLLLCITYATTYFKSFYFEAALTVNLTVMLVQTTLFIRYHVTSINYLKKKCLECDGEVATHLLCETGGYLVDLWTAHPIHRGHSSHIERGLQ